MKSEKRTPDNDPFYRSPKAWARMKALFNGCHLKKWLERMEKSISPACPRHWLCVALHHFTLTMTALQRFEAEQTYWAWQNGEKTPYREIYVRNLASSTSSTTSNG